MAGRSNMRLATITPTTGKGVDAVRPIRDEIRARVEALIAEIAPA